MRKVLVSGMVLLALAGPGMAKTVERHERLIACYKQVKVPAKYKVSKVLIKAAERKYIKRNGRIELVEYPAIYREDREKISDEHLLMQQIPCN